MEQCATSVKVNGMYEATGLALWLRTGVWSMGKDRDIDPGDVSFGALERFSSIYFSKDVSVKTYVTREAKRQKPRDRLLWPCPMVAACDAVSEVEKTHFENSLNILSCHFVLWSWYLALAKAIGNNAAGTFKCFVVLERMVAHSQILQALATPIHDENISMISCLKQLPWSMQYSGQRVAVYAVGGRPDRDDSSQTLS